MPAPIILQDMSGIAEGISGAGSVLGQALMKRGELQREQKKQGALQNVINQADFSSPQGQKTFLMGAIRQGMDPKDAMKVISEMKPSMVENFISQYSGGTGQNIMPNQGTPVSPEGIANPNLTETSPTPAMNHPATAQDPFSFIPEEALVYAAGSDDENLREFGKAILDNRDRSYKRWADQRDYQTGLSKKYVEGINDERESVRGQRQAIESLKMGFQSRDMSQFSRDWWAQKFGEWGQGLVTPEGALVSGNIKNFLLADLGSLKGRPNQFIEQRILSMTPQIGQQLEANEAATLALESQLELKEKKIEVADEIMQKYLNDPKFGYVPGNLGAMVDAQLRPYQEQAQDRLAYRMRRLQERSEGIEKLTNKKVMQGTPLTVEMAAELTKKWGKEKAPQVAKKLGYTIPTEEQYRKYQ